MAITANDGEARVVEVLPGAMFRVERPDGSRLVAHLDQRARLSAPRLIPGDRVSIDVSPFDTSRAKITKRLA